MTTVFYKKILGHYEISEICESSGEDIRFEFEEPIDGKLVISNSVFDIFHGVCQTKVSNLSEGDISPKIYTGGDMQKIESFIVKQGAVLRKARGEDYIRGLSVTVDALLCRVQILEEKIAEVQNKIERKITF